MANAFCGNCGSKLNENSNFCSSCGHKIEMDSTGPSNQVEQGKEEKEEILSVSNSSKRTFVNIVLFIVIGMFAVSFYFTVYMLAFRWERVTDIIFDDYNGDSFVFFVLLPVGYLLGIIIISMLFKNLIVSKLFVRITFLTSIIIVGMFSLHILFTTFLYFNSEKAIEAVMGYYPSSVGYHLDAIVEESQAVLKSKIDMLLVNVVVAIGFIAIVLNRYFKKNSLGFIAGLKGIFKKPSINGFIKVFKQLT